MPVVKYIIDCRDCKSRNAVLGILYELDALDALARIKAEQEVKPLGGQS